MFYHASVRYAINSLNKTNILLSLTSFLKRHVCVRQKRLKTSFEASTIDLIYGLYQCYFYQQNNLNSVYIKPIKINSPYKRRQ